MEYSTVFDKCPSPVNWVEPANAIYLRPHVMAPRPGLEPGTYGLTESQARQKPL